MTTLEKFRLTAVTWDSDKDPNGYTRWIGIIGSLVRSTQHGNELEDFLDAKLQRSKAKATTIPSFLMDSDFEMPSASSAAPADTPATPSSSR